MTGVFTEKWCNFTDFYPTEIYCYWTKFYSIYRPLSLPIFSENHLPTHPYLKTFWEKNRKNKNLIFHNINHQGGGGLFALQDTLVREQYFFEKFEKL